MVLTVHNHSFETHPPHRFLSMFFLKTDNYNGTKVSKVSRYGQNLFVTKTLEIFFTQIPLFASHKLH